MIRSWQVYARKIADSAGELLGSETEVFVFGSVIKGETTAASDVDILVITGDRSLASVQERNRISMMLEDAASLPNFHPFQIHVVDKKEAKVYLNHLGSKILRI